MEDTRVVEVSAQRLALIKATLSQNSPFKRGAGKTAGLLADLRLVRKAQYAPEEIDLVDFIRTHNRMA